MLYCISVSAIIENTQVGVEALDLATYFNAYALFKDDCRDHFFTAHKYPYPGLSFPHANTPQGHLTLDLGGVTTVNSITMRNFRNGVANQAGIDMFTIEVSNSSNSNWQPIIADTMENPSTSALCTVSPETFSLNGAIGRYLKLTVVSHFGDLAIINYLDLDYIEPENAFECQQFACPELIAFNIYEREPLRYRPQNVLLDLCELDYTTYIVPFNVYLGPTYNDPKAYLTFDFSVEVLITEVQFRNPYRSTGRATKDFSVKVAARIQIWFTILEGVLKDTVNNVYDCNTALETFQVDRQIRGRYAKVTAEDKYAVTGAGFQYIHFIYSQ